MEKIKTTNVNVSFCLYCALLIEYHTGRVLSSHNFYIIHGQLDTETHKRFSGKSKSAVSGIYLIPSLTEKLPNQRYLNTTNLIYQVSPASVRKSSHGNETELKKYFPVLPEF